MKNKNGMALRYGVNQIWMFLVIIHIMGAVVVSSMGNIPYGLAVFVCAMWIFVLYIQRENKKSLYYIIPGWILTLVLLLNMQLSYQESLIQNGITAVFLLYICAYNQVDVKKQYSLKKIAGKDILLILMLALCFIIIASYVNNISMLFFKNYVSEELKDVRGNVFSCIITYAIAPAIIEELVFRGCIFSEISDRRKAIVISSVYFALLHLNFNQMSYAFIIGMFFGYVMYMTGNIVITIIIHMIFNCFSILSSLVASGSVLENILTLKIINYEIFNPVFLDKTGHILMENVLVGGILIIVATIVTVLLLKKGYKEQENEIIKSLVVGNGESWKPDFYMLIGCLLCILTALLFLILIG